MTLRSRSALVPHVLVGLACLLVAYDAWHGSPGFNQFSDRDTARALLWRQELPVSGAEMSGGRPARVPGIGLFVLMGLPMVLFHDLHAVFLAMVAQLLLGVAVLQVGLSRLLGPWPAAAASLLFLTATPVWRTLTDLWNPSFLPLPLAVATVALVWALVERDARALPVWTFAASVAAQTHLSVLGWVLATLPGLAFTRLEHRARGWSMAAGAVLVAYAPYLVVDGWRGWPNTRELLGKGEASVEERRVELEHAWGALRNLFETPELPDDVRLSPVADPLWALGVVLFLAGLVAAKREHRPLAWTLGGSLVLVLGTYAGGAVTYMTARYVVTLVPAVAVVSALALAAVPEGRRTAVSAVVVTLLATRADIYANTWSANDAFGYHQFRLAFDQLAEQTGQSTTELASRTWWLSVNRDGSVADGAQWPRVDHLLFEEGTEFPGSGPPPCHLMVAGAEDQVDLRDPDDVARIAFSDAPLRILDVRPLEGRWTWVRYDTDAGLCPTSMAQRYLDTSADGHVGGGAAQAILGPSSGRGRGPRRRRGVSSRVPRARRRSHRHRLRPGDRRRRPACTRGRRRGHAARAVPPGPVGQRGLAGDLRARAPQGRAVAR